MIISLLIALGIAAFLFFTRPEPIDTAPPLPPIPPGLTPEEQKKLLDKLTNPGNAPPSGGGTAPPVSPNAAKQEEIRRLNEAGSVQ